MEGSSRARALGDLSNVYALFVLNSDVRLTFHELPLACACHIYISGTSGLAGRVRRESSGAKSGLQGSQDQNCRAVCVTLSSDSPSTGFLGDLLGRPGRRTSNPDESPGWLQGSRPYSGKLARDSDDHTEHPYVLDQLLPVPHPTWAPDRTPDSFPT